MIFKDIRKSTAAAQRTILGNNRFPAYTKTRAASRALIIRGDSILLAHEVNEDQLMIPGGGLEENETPEACCIREAEEETGLIVNIIKGFLTLTEYYEEYRYISYYYVCEVTGNGMVHRTDAEIKAGLKPEWVPLGKALEIFSHHEEYSGIYEMRRGMYQREYIALKEYYKQIIDIEELKLPDLQPSQFKISEKKLQHVQEWFRAEDLSNFDPIPVTILDGELIMTDGHTRAAAALLAGADKVPLIWDDDELDWEMYRRCVVECRNRGVNTPVDFLKQIIPESDYSQQWDKWCDQMQEEVKTERNQALAARIIPLPKEEWKGTRIMMRYTTEEYFDLEVVEEPDALRFAIVKKKFDAPVTHTPEEYDFPDSLYQDHWEGAQAWGIVSEEDGEKKLLACIEICPEEWSNRLLVTELWVADELQRRGVGTSLMNLAREKAKEQKRRAIILETQSCNVRAISFYLSQGFELIGFDTCCYSNRDVERHEIRFNFGLFIDAESNKDKRR